MGEYRGAERGNPIPGQVIQFDQAQREKQVDVAPQALDGHAAAPHRKAVAGALQQLELIAGQGRHPDSVARRPPATSRRLAGFWPICRAAYYPARCSNGLPVTKLDCLLTFFGVEYGKASRGCCISCPDLHCAHDLTEGDKTWRIHRLFIPAMEYLGATGS